MSWQKKISEGLYRISLALSIFFGASVFLLLFFTEGEGIVFSILVAIILSTIIFLLIAVLNWIIRGFID